LQILFPLSFGHPSIDDHLQLQKATAKNLRLKREAKVFSDVVSANGSIWKNANKT